MPEVVEPEYHLVTIGCMGKSKKTPPEDDTPPPGDRHKPSFMVRVPMAFADGLDEMVELHQSDRTEEVKAAVREYLEKHGRWPPQHGRRKKPSSESE